MLVWRKRLCFRVCRLRGHSGAPQNGRHRLAVNAVGAGMEQLKTFSWRKPFQHPTSADSVRDTITDKEGKTGSGYTAKRDRVEHDITRYNILITEDVLSIECV